MGLSKKDWRVLRVKTHLGRLIESYEGLIDLVVSDGLRNEVVINGFEYGKGELEAEIDRCAKDIIEVIEG